MAVLIPAKFPVCFSICITFRYAAAAGRAALAPTVSQPHANRTHARIDTGNEEGSHAGKHKSLQDDGRGWLFEGRWPGRAPAGGKEKWKLLRSVRCNFYFAGQERGLRQNRDAV